MTDPRRLLAPELRVVLDQLPLTTLTSETLRTARERTDQVVAQRRAETPPFPAIEVDERRIAGWAGAPKVRVLVYRPRAPAASRPGLLWIHGGGYVAGVPEQDDWQVKRIVEAVGCVVVSVDYRLAPEHPHPAPVDDCYAALAWLHAQAAPLGIDAARIGIAGVSAGGGLCAAVALLARDRGEIAPCFLAPLQPMLDDRTACLGDAHPTAGKELWTNASNHFGWSALLGHEPGRGGVSHHAVPARAPSYAGLPPTYIATGALDLFVEEDIEFARRLMRDGVPTELHVWPGVCHAFDTLAPQFELSQAYERAFHLALRRGLGAAAPGPADEPAQELMQHLKAIAPGIPERDLPRFARSLSGPEPYAPGLDSQPREGVPRGKVLERRHTSRDAYPGVSREYRVYVPNGLGASRPAALMVFQDGARYLGPECNAATVLDNLIASGAVPPIVGVFVQPGEKGPGLPIYGGTDNRSLEYDAMGDAYARFLIEELLPEATEGLPIAADAASHALCGLSSGGHCALNAALERTDFFGKVVSHCGSFVAIRGGDTLAAKIRRGGAKPLRVFLQTGVRDLDIVFGHWVQANRTIAAALDYCGIEHRLVVGDGGHSLAHGGALFPDTLRWLWREPSIDPSSSSTGASR